MLTVTDTVYLTDDKTKRDRRGTSEGCLDSEVP